MASISFDRVTKAFDRETVAVRDLTLTIADGEFMVLVGPSGSGKSTALRMVAGLEDVTDGTVRIGERVVNDVAPRDRDIAMVFQNYALYPHMSVRENLGFALRMRRERRNAIRERVDGAARMLGIAELLDRRPRQLSGGQRQRVAMGRAIVREPRAFLMDEPLSNLDAKLRVEMRAYVARLHQRLGTTTLYVTHDQTEAMTMADRVAVMRDGRVEQVATSRTIYERPANVFVAAFIGSPAMNLARATIDAVNGAVVVSLGPHRIRLPEPLRWHGLGRYLGRDVVLGVRPEGLSEAGDDGDQALDVEVALAEPLGAETVVHFALEAEPVRTEARFPDDGEADEGEAHFTARFGSGATVDRGDRIRLGVDPAHLHFFDPETEAAIA
jgi:multiple sugar transport system ATP-binding protein